MKRTTILSLALLLSMSTMAQRTTSISLNPAEAKDKINKEIYGQFAEHLGTCIYGGLWVGPESSIPNTNNGILLSLHIAVAVESITFKSFSKTSI